MTDDELAATRTMWNIAPMTQGFIVAVFQLHEAGKLDIRDPVDRYVAALDLSVDLKDAATVLALERALAGVLARTVNVYDY